MAEIEFRLLGPLEVWQGGRRLQVPGAKPRALLAMLLLHAREPVSTDRLIDALWDESPPATAANALQAHVAHLRRALEPHRVLVTRAPGYLLEVADADIDVRRFERLIERGCDCLPGDPAEAADVFRDALALWHGPGLADFASEPFVRAEAAHLEELRLVALEHRLEADLRLGRHVDVIPELEALLKAHPYRECLAVQLMTALYRSERQADASGVYHAVRARLVEELGIEPGVALREVHQRVLEQDPALRSPTEAHADGDAAPADAGRPRRSTPIAAKRRSHNLPLELTSFVGRERECEELSALLPMSRLLTLTGAGGSGKTRLAVRVAREALDRYSDGVWLVELASIGDPMLITKALAAALGVREESAPLIETLQRRLAGACVLLVLDNCEHLVGGCAELAHVLLSTCGGVRILATSREPLNVAGEITWPVPGLALPAPSTAATELEEYAAVRLFAERGAASQPGFVLDAGNARAAAQVCRRLDGMPLAIELAAARLRVLSPGEIEQRLDNRFALLTGGHRGALTRQQTLRATVEWSHDLLDHAQRALFRRLSVFAGGWTAADAERVCADEALPEASVLSVLCALVEKSLAVTEAVPDGPNRYRMLETLREYGQEQLQVAGEQRAVQRRHLSHYLELAERSREQKLRTGSDVGLGVLISEQDNLRAALAFAHRTDARALLRLAMAMDQLWHAGDLAEGRRWLSEALANETASTRERAHALHAAASLSDLQQEHARARELAKEAVAISSSLGDEAGEAWALVTLGMIEFTAENHAEATRHLERALALHEALGQQLGVARSRIFLAVGMTVVTGGDEAGRVELQHALRLAQELGDRWGEGFALVFLGLADLDAGAHDLAATRFRQALMAEALGPIRAGPLDGLAELACERDPARSLRLLAAASSLRERQGGRPPPIIRRRAATVRAHAEQLLGQDLAQQAWAEGRQMATEEAIAYALEAWTQTCDRAPGLDKQPAS